MTSTSISRQLILTGAEFKREVTLYNASINLLVLEDPEELGDEALILEKDSKTPLELLAIGYWYEDLEQVSDEEVAQLIKRSGGAKVGETNDTDT